MKKLLPFLLMFFCAATAGAQTAPEGGNIPIGAWRTHFSYARVQEVAIAGSRVYAASEGGFFYYDKDHNEIAVLGPQKGFSDGGVSALGWQEETKRLLIGYRNGNIDLLQESKITTISSIRTAQFRGSKAIHAVAFRGDSALVATDYGISIINLAQARLLDSYLNLGADGQRLVVHDVAVLNDTLYAATDSGLIANRLSPSINLNDFRTWRRFGPEEGVPQSGTHFIEVLAQQLWVANQQGGLYRKQGSELLKISFGDTIEVVDLQSGRKGDALTITGKDAVYRYSIQEGSASTLRHELIKSPFTAVEDADGTYWIGDGFNGLLTTLEGGLSRRNPGGPLYDAVTALQYANGQVVALFGGDSEFGAPAGTKGFSTFASGTGWVNYHPQQRAGSNPMPDVQDLRAAAYSDKTNSWYFASYSDGLLVWQPQENQFKLWGLNTAGVSFAEAVGYPGKVLLSGVAVDGEGNVWMSSYGSRRPLHRFRPADDNWQAYLEGNYAASQARQLIIPFTNDVWLRLDPQVLNASGILVFNPAKQPTNRLLISRGGEGGLVSDKVSALQEDLEGSVWIGTADGLDFIPNPAAVLSNSPIDASLPIFQQRPLLDESRITALAVDGGNRKWIGTTNGIWLFGDAGDTLYYHFTTANSPLPANTITAVTVDQKTGEVFIATDQGLVSYRSGATLGGSTHASAIKIFPNPVRPGYQGRVGITGLVQDAIVKITDTAGFLVRELPAEGGTASWDLRDSRGSRVATGVYLIFSANELGTEALVGKVAVVR